MVAKKKHNAYSLAELVMVCVLMGICAMVAVPRMNLAVIKKYKSQTTAHQIITDLRLVRNLAITSAATNNTGFALKMVGSSPYRTYRIINLATNAEISSHTLVNDVQCTGGINFNFGPLGNLKTGSDTTLVVSAQGSTTTITIIPATGSITYGN